MNREPANVFSAEFWGGFWRDLKLVFYVTRDPRTPLGIRAIPFLIILYLVSPVDLIPGIVPLLGQIDDLAILLMGVRFFLQMAPEEIINEYRERV